MWREGTGICILLELPSPPFCFFVPSAALEFVEVCWGGRRGKGGGCEPGQVHSHCRLESPTFTFKPTALKIEKKRGWGGVGGGLQTISLDSSFRKGS